MTTSLVDSWKLWFLFFLVFLFELLAVSDNSVTHRPTLQIQVNGVIGPGTYDYLQRSLEKAQNENASSILLLMNTPGGNLQTTRMMVETILSSKIPFLCLVYPGGGHAGSAGAIILQACHVSGAVEATNIGAATPVTLEGEMGKDMRNKVLNDTVSWVEALTTLRGRNKDFSRDIITQAKSVTSTEAANVGAIDFEVKSIEEFLLKSHDKKVKVGSGDLKVETGTLIAFDPDLRYRVLDLMTHPQFAYLMFMGSLALIYFELTHPGFVAPGVAGALGLVASLISFHMLDVKWGGVALIVLGILFLVAEMFVTSFGVLAIGGIISFVLGSLFLFDSNSEPLPLSTILPSALGLSLIMLGIGYLAFSARMVRKKNEDVVGGTGRITKLKSSRTGSLEIHGEIWSFVSSEDLHEKDSVKILGREGLVLDVRKNN